MLLERIETTLVFCSALNVTYNVKLSFTYSPLIVSQLLLDTLNALFNQSTLDASRVISSRHHTMMGILISESTRAVFVSRDVVCVIGLAQVGEPRRKSQRQNLCFWMFVR